MAACQMLGCARLGRLPCARVRAMLALALALGASGAHAAPSAASASLGRVRDVAGARAAAALARSGSGVWGAAACASGDAPCGRALALAAAGSSGADGGEALRFALVDDEAAEVLLGGDYARGGGSVAMIVGSAQGAAAALPGAVDAESLVRGALGALPMGGIETVSNVTVPMFFLRGRRGEDLRGRRGEDVQATGPQAVLVGEGEGPPVWWRALAAEFEGEARGFGYAQAGDPDAAKYIGAALGVVGEREVPYVAILPPGKPDIQRLVAAPPSARDVRLLLAAMLRLASPHEARGAAGCEAWDVVCADRADEPGGWATRQAFVAEHLSGPRHVSKLRDEDALRALYEATMLEGQSGFVLVALPPEDEEFEEPEVQALDAMAQNAGVDIMPLIPYATLRPSAGDMYALFVDHVGADMDSDVSQLVLVHPGSRRAAVYAGSATLSTMHKVIGGIITEAVKDDLRPLARSGALPGLPAEAARAPDGEL